MAKTTPFDTRIQDYESWFDRNPAVYQSELEAVRRLLPLTAAGSVSRPAQGLEIGVGSGLFAAPLKIADGVEPSAAMRGKAASRGISVQEGTAEALPYPDAAFDFTLVVTAICFVDSIDQTLKEIRRVLKPKGIAVFGFIDKEAPLGRLYQEHKEENIFYKDAVFYSAREIIRLLDQYGMPAEDACQTVFGPLEEIRQTQPPAAGFGEGGFVVLKGRKTAPNIPRQ